MTWGAIATWRMAHDGLLKATEELQQGGVRHGRGTIN